jgi:hypothetical protein
MRITRRTVAGGIAALAVLPAATVLAAPSASAEPRPQHADASQSQPQGAVAGTKAQLERDELLERRTKAAIEHGESVARVPAVDTSSADGGSALPWVVGGIAVLGVAGATAGSAALLRRRPPQSRPV